MSRKGKVYLLSKEEREEVYEFIEEQAYWILYLLTFDLPYTRNKNGENRWT